jgi:phosphatidylinositol 4-kinase
MRQAAISTLYALLNEITRYSDDENGRQSMNSSTIPGAPAAELLNESQKQQVCVNALSAIVGVAVYLKDESVNMKHSMTKIQPFTMNPPPN